MRLKFLLALLVGLAILIIGVSTKMSRKVSAFSLAVTNRYVSNAGVDVGDCSNPLSPCLTITYAVSQSVDGDTINVAAGSYSENVSTITQLTFRGAQAGVDARGRVGAESIWSPAFAGTATLILNGTMVGAVVDGFSFTGGTSPGLIQTQGGTDFSNLMIINNSFSGYSQSAVFMNRGGADITIDKNVMDGSNITVSSPGGGQAIFGNGTESFRGLYVTNNNIINNTGRYGVLIDGNHNVGESATRAPSINGNLFDKNHQGLHLGSRSFGTLAAPTLGAYGGTITNNIFSNNSFNGMQAGLQHVLLSGNTFRGNSLSGLSLTSFGVGDNTRGTQNSTITCNLFTGNGSEGIFISSFQVGLATNHINQNNFACNFTGLSYNGGDPIDVANNYWNSATGPTIASNPGGTGEKINNPSGSLIYTPFLTTSSSCAASPDCDRDGVPDNVDNCARTANSDQADSDGDGVGDACDNCPMVSNPDQAESDGDGIADACDNCPNNANRNQLDSDHDGVGDICDQCRNDPNKIAPGVCGCGVPDSDSDHDGAPDCNDQCPNDPNKTAPGVCGCGVADGDTDHDGTLDCIDACPNDPNKTAPGACGCGIADTDTDHDGTPDCYDACPGDPSKITPGACGCGIPDTDTDGDGIPNCQDNCPVVANADQRDTNNDGVGDACTAFQFPSGGLFVIGDYVNISNGATVYFWGSQWSQNNPMSGGSGPNSFKGFEDRSQSASCGGNWISLPGNSSNPPATIPEFMGVIVSSSVTQNGSSITGNVQKIIVIKTDPSYRPNPGHPGTGKVIAIFCATTSSAGLKGFGQSPPITIALFAGFHWLEEGVVALPDTRSWRSGI